ncbi:small integral membrane protein 4-like [Eriocheir sinensis]|uniref:small integral membrane protein 4-like n=1 Tax=Eriocheir sinensis TaxID=95602 RepID=UPI0021CA4647|nr:small integral membrane protein 4-like [Eriocheir sinensis]
MAQRLQSRRLQHFLNRWPGRRTFGMYRFLPAFFLLGAALEFSMINWHYGQTNFYRTFKRRQASEIALKQLQQEEAF